MLKKITVILAIFILIAPVFAQYDEDIPVTREEMLRRAEEKYVKHTELETFRHYKDAYVGPDDVIEGNMVVMRGDIEIRGEVDGDVVVMYGDVQIENQAIVGGDVVAIGGKISQDRYSTVHGNQIETSPKNIFRHTSDNWNFNYNYDYDYDYDYQYEYEYEHDYEYNSHRNQYSTLPIWNTDEDLLVRYNRVQGLFLGLDFPKSIRGKNKFVSIYGFGGYGFKEEAWRYQIGIDRYFFNQKDYRFELGGKLYDLTDTKDDWVITPMENSLAAFFTHQDFQDFYNRKGFEIYMSQNWTIFFKGMLAYRNDDYNSQIKNTEWSLFYDKRKFKLNPAIDEGNMRSVYGELYLDTRNDHEYPRRGWYGKFSVETSNSKLNSDFSFNQYILDVRNYIPLSRYERIDLRFKVGSSEGELPFQKLYQIGGLSTLRGFDYKEFQGDRMLLFNAEYVVSPSSFTHDFLFFDDIRLIVFTDAGLAWDKGAQDEKFTDGFQYITFDKLKSDIGIAFSDWKGHVRLNIAKRTDTNEKPLVVTFRLSKPF